jgi:bifunctional DNA-binding transcriptional regulator/antitoxin component of YhaV-PrlF toxin-antitoxin module
MQQESDLAEVTVSESGVVIPAETLRAAGIRPGDRVLFARTTRGSLLVLPGGRGKGGPSLRAVVGIAPRPAGMGPADDETFLREIRSGDDARSRGR